MRELAFPLIRAAAAASPSDTLVLLPLLINHLTREELPDVHFSLMVFFFFLPQVFIIYLAASTFMHSDDCIACDLRAWSGGSVPRPEAPPRQC